MRALKRRSTARKAARFFATSTARSMISKRNFVTAPRPRSWRARPMIGAAAPPQIGPRNSQTAQRSIQRWNALSRSPPPWMPFMTRDRHFFANVRPLPQRVLMTADTVGGVWTYALELARVLCEQEVEITLATMGA